MAAADPSLLYKLVSFDLSPRLPIARTHAHTPLIRKTNLALYKFWYPSLRMGVFQQRDSFCVILSRWIGQKCGKSIRIPGRSLTEISVTATLNSNRMRDELTVNAGDGSRSSRTDGGVLLSLSLGEQQAWIYDGPQDEDGYLHICRKTLINTWWTWGEKKISWRRKATFREFGAIFSWISYFIIY